ncbi:hypothetical protein ACFL0C_00020 [Patescibacteria group bacterium]
MNKKTNNPVKEAGKDAVLKLPKWVKAILIIAAVVVTPATIADILIIDPIPVIDEVALVGIEGIILWLLSRPTK